MLTKNTLMSRGKKVNLRIINEAIEVLDSFCLLGLTTNSKETSRQGVHHRLALGRIVMKSAWISGSTFMRIYLVG